MSMDMLCTRTLDQTCSGSCVRNLCRACKTSCVLICKTIGAHTEAHVL